MATKEQREQADEALGELLNLFQNKIEELCNIKGAQTERHAFLYYRDLAERVRDNLAERFDVATCLIQEIEYENDEGGWRETPKQRWERMRRWTDKNIIERIAGMGQA